MGSTFYSVQHGPGGEIIDESERQRLTDNSPKNSGNMVKADTVGGTYRVTYGPNGATNSTENVTRVSSMEPFSVAADYSVVSTGRDKIHGRPLAPAQLTQDSLVNVGGIETTVKGAVSLGLVRPTPGGGFEDVTKERPAQTTPREAQQVSGQVDQTKQATMSGANSTIDMGPHGASEPLSDENASQFRQAVSDTVPPEQVRQAIDEVIRDGQLSERSVARLATSMGISTEDAQAQFANLARAYDSQRNAALAELGIEGETGEMFMEFLQLKAQKANDALRQQYRNGNLNGFRELAKQFWTDYVPYTDPDLLVDVAKASGYDAYFDPSRDAVILRLPDAGEVTYKSALASGLIRTPVFG